MRVWEGRTGGARICVSAWNAVVTAKSEKAGPGLWNPMETHGNACGLQTWKHEFPEDSFQWSPGTQTTKHIWLMIHRSHGTLAFTDASDLPKPTWANPRCELCFSRLLLPESHAQCVLIQTGTPDSQVRFGQKGCISKTVVDKGAFIRGPIRGLYEVSLYGLSRSSPWASEARLLHLSWQQQRRRKSSSRRKQQQQDLEEAAAAATAAGGSSSSRQAAARSSSKQQ